MGAASESVAAGRRRAGRRRRRRSVRETEVGPVVSGTAPDEVLEAIDRERREGGTVVAGGARGHDESSLLEPTVFEAVADDAYLSCEEVFEPVTSLYRFSDLDEAIQRANGVPFGLPPGIFTATFTSSSGSPRRCRRGSST